MIETIEPYPTTAVLDGDIIAYRAAFWAETEGVEYLKDRIEHDLKSWTPPGMTKVYVARSCKRADNYRRKVWDAYKRHRDINRQIPEHLEYAEELTFKNNPLSSACIEADDIMGIMASSYKAVAVTIDKDLRSVRGWHWNPDKEPQPILLDARTAEYNFHKQWLMGDTTDNIPGIWKLGPVKACRILDGVQPGNWTDAVMATYETSKDREGNPYTLEYCMAMAHCVRILRWGEYNKDTKLPLLWEPFPIVGATKIDP